MNAFQIQAEAALVLRDSSDCALDAVRAAFTAAGLEDVCPKVHRVRGPKGGDVHAHPSKKAFLSFGLRNLSLLFMMKEFEVGSTPTPAAKRREPQDLNKPGEFAMISFGSNSVATLAADAPEPHMPESRETDAMPEQAPSSDPVRQKAVKLFRYLAALVELRTKTIRDCESYEAVFWFSDLPIEPECFTPAWSGERENEDETWLRIEKPQKPQLPEPPRACQPWVDRDRLADATRQPVLYDEIIDPRWLTSHQDSQEPSEEAEAPRLRIVDYPEVLEAWQSYVENKWTAWSERYQRWERVQKVYRQVFAIYQMQRRRGEQFELVLGVGTLLWTTSGHRVCRPIITGRVVIPGTAFRHNSCVACRRGASFKLEQDMLEVEERPPVTDQQQCRQALSHLETIWDRHEVFEIL